MGLTQAMGMAEQVGEGNIRRRAALTWHLTANHYPPIPEDMVNVALAAIEALEEGDPSRYIALPDGITHRRYSEGVPASEVVDALHLEAFIRGEV